ncbi:MAG: urease accessory protein [Mycobacteriales bacterium]
MRARAAVVAAADRAGRTRLTMLRSQPPLTLRPTAGALYLAASAAGPLGGDDLGLSIVVGPGAELVLRTVAASVVLPGPGPSAFTVRLSVAAGGRLTVLPEPTVVAAGACHRASTLAEVEAGGALLLREEVLLGRHGEPGGRYRGLLRVDVGGAPLLRHRLDLDGTDPATVSPASMVGATAVGTLLQIAPQWTDPAARPAGTVSPTCAVMPLAGPGLLVTALRADALDLRRDLDAQVSYLPPPHPARPGPRP